YAGASFAADEPAKSSLVAKPAEAAPKPSELTQWLDGWSTTHVPEATPGTLGYALLHGTPWVVLRYRYETVEQNGLKDGVASTLRTRFGY
ncbi:hypothetical protein WAC31_28845, partial [Klebsiella pneumoniae]|uniref:hypothetical protein n=1 Tax=Klebsiella pneumoniae TaxID=573 RepID=UPI003012DD78